MDDIPFQPQCSVCVAFIRDKATSYVSSCGHLFCAKCFVSPDTCSICREPCDYLNLTDTTEYPDLHSCLFGTFKAHAEKLGAMVNVRSCCVGDIELSDCKHCPRIFNCNTFNAIECTFLDAHSAKFQADKRRSTILKLMDQQAQASCRIVFQYYMCKLSGFGNVNYKNLHSGSLKSPMRNCGNS